MEKGFYEVPFVEDALMNLVFPEGQKIDGQTFLHGECGIFALALHDTYGYDLGWLLDDDEENESDNPWHHLVHVFCITNVDGEDDPVYIDVRGCQTNESRFEDPFEDFFVEPNYVYGVSYETIRDNIWMEMSKEEYDTFYKAAKLFIEQCKEFYKP